MQKEWGFAVVGSARRVDRLSPVARGALARFSFLWSEENLKVSSEWEGTA